MFTLWIWSWSSHVPRPPPLESFFFFCLPFPELDSPLEILNVSRLTVVMAMGGVAGRRGLQRVAAAVALGKDACEGNFGLKNQK